MSAAMLAAMGAACCAALAAAQLDAAHRGVSDGGTTGGLGAAQGETATPSGAVLTRHLASIGRTPVATRSILAFVAGTVGLQVGGLVAAIIVGAVAVGAAAARERRAVGRAARQRERAAPALARAMADALRGGASVRGALITASSDRAVPSALREETTVVARAITVGSPLTEALTRLAGQGGPTLRLLCGTTAMHLEAGGALATALDRLAADGESAQRIDEDRIAATAQARATVRVVAALPVLALLGAQAVTGNFLSVIAQHPVALCLLLLGFALEGAAIVAARAIVGSGR